MTGIIIIIALYLHDTEVESHYECIWEAKSNFPLHKLYLDENVVSIALQKEIFPSVWLFDIKRTWVQNVVSLVNNVC